MSFQDIDDYGSPQLSKLCICPHFLVSIGLWLYHVETLVLVWSQKLSSIKPGQYIDEWPLGDTRYCKLGNASGVMDNDLKLKIGEPSSSSSQGHLFFTYTQVPSGKVSYWSISALVCMLPSYLYPALSKHCPGLFLLKDIQNVFI